MPKKNGNVNDASNGGKLERKDEAGRYVPGAHVWARYSGDGSFRDCEVIDLQVSKDHNEVKYYLHYVEFNRRMDTWVTEDHVSDKNPENPEAELSVS